MFVSLLRYRGILICDNIFLIAPLVNVFCRVTSKVGLKNLIHVGFLMDKVALRNVLLRVLLFFPVNIPPLQSILISTGG
jgi:hypothetical protein